MCDVHKLTHSYYLYLKCHTVHTPLLFICILELVLFCHAEKALCPTEILWPLGAKHYDGVTMCVQENNCDHWCESTTSVKTDGHLCLCFYTG